MEWAFWVVWIGRGKSEKLYLQSIEEDNIAEKEKQESFVPQGFLLFLFSGIDV